MPEYLWLVVCGALGAHVVVLVLPLSATAMLSLVLFNNSSLCVLVPWLQLPLG